MTYYTNSNQIQSLISDLVEVPLKGLEEAPKQWNVSVFIFDDLFKDRPLDTYLFDGEPNAMSFKTLWEKRPEWGGAVLELMKKSCSVHLCLDEETWYRVFFCKNSHFQFRRENPPYLDSHHVCLISTEEHLSEVREAAFRTLIHPLMFGQSMMRRLHETGTKDAKFTVGGYISLCYELERLTKNAQHQRNLWKYRFFFHTMHVDNDQLCSDCKEDMRRLFYEESSEIKALRWRPGSGCGGACEWSPQVFEELEDDVEYL